LKKFLLNKVNKPLQRRQLKCQNPQHRSLLVLQVEGILEVQVIAVAEIFLLDFFGKKIFAQDKRPGNFDILISTGLFVATVVFFAELWCRITIRLKILETYKCYFFIQV